MAATIPGAGITTPLTLTEDGNLDTLTLTSTDADANSGPNIVFNRDSASPADNDIVGQFTFRADNDAGEATDYCRFRTHLQDVTNGEEDGNFRLFTLVAGAEVSRIDIDKDEIVLNEDSVDVDFRVESNDDDNCLRVKGDTNRVGIGTNSPDYKLAVHQDEDNIAVGHFRHTGNNSSSNPQGIFVEFSGSTPDDTGSVFINCSDVTSGRFLVTANGNATNHDNSYGQISDERIKQNITDANSQWDDIKALKVKNFERKDDVAAYGEGKKVQIGLIAQECEAVSPGLVKESEPMAEDIKMSSEFGTLNEDGTIKTTTGEKVKSISYSVLYMKAIKALQEAMAKIEALETSNTDLKNRVTALEG